MQIGRVSQGKQGKGIRAAPYNHVGTVESGLFANRESESTLDLSPSSPATAGSGSGLASPRPTWTAAGSGQRRAVPDTLKRGPDPAAHRSGEARGPGAPPPRPALPCHSFPTSRVSTSLRGPGRARLGSSGALSLHEQTRLQRLRFRARRWGDDRRTRLPCALKDPPKSAWGNGRQLYKDKPNPSRSRRLP